MFFCNPGASWEKGSCENNHRLLRFVLPKKTSFDNLAQEDIELLMSHVNSYTRKVLNDKTPYDIFEVLYGKGILEKLGVNRIQPNDIILTPSLLK